MTAPDTIPQARLEESSVEPTHERRFLDRIVADLRAFSGELLDAGRQATAGIVPPVAGSTQMLIDSVRALVALVPPLIQQLDAIDAGGAMLEVSTAIPVGAALSRRPADWVLESGRSLPRRWTLRVPECALDSAPLSWLLHLLRLQSQHLSAVEARVVKQVEEAAAARRGCSAWARADERALDAILGRLRFLALALERAQREVLLASDHRAAPFAKKPASLPRSPAWSALQRLSAALVDPRRSLAAQVSALLSARDAVDVPTLYQRWCGVKLLEALAACGWARRGDPVGALYLGGRIELSKDDARIELWIDARFGRVEHAAGFRCTRNQEVTPDFVVITPGRGGPDAFVLDATKTSDDEVLRDKARYLDLLAGCAPTFVAGVAIERRPLRSWAVAPLERSNCRLFEVGGRLDGRAGVIPLDPLRFDPRPLQAWIEDVDRHAMAHMG